jgi:hypothetical protein
MSFGRGNNAASNQESTTQGNFRTIDLRDTVDRSDDDFQFVGGRGQGEEKRAVV